MARRRASAVLLTFVLALAAAAVSVGPRASSASPPRAFGKWFQSGKVHPDLYALQDHGKRSHSTSTSRRYGPRVADGFVTISAVPVGDGSGLLAELQRMGLVDGTATTKMVTGRLPIGSIDGVGELDSLQFIRPEWIVRSAVQGQGDAALKADATRSTFGVTGTGVTVGTLSDSFNCEGAAFQDEIVDVQVLKEGPCAEGALDEGRAMMELIADVAPGAKQLFHTAAETQLDFAAGIRALKDAGADVINDDIGYPAAPWFQDGVVAQAVDAVVAEGVPYFSAAGNSGRASYQARYSPGSIKDPTGVPFSAHDFDAGPDVDPTQRVTVPPGSVGFVFLQWDDNFKTQFPDGPAPETDMAIIGLDPATGDLLAPPSLFINLPNAVTLEPVEAMLVLNTSNAPMPVDVAILKLSGPDPRLLKWIDVAGTANPLKIEEHDAGATGTIFGHSQALGAMSLGAASALDTSTPPTLETYSSVGGGQITRDVDGRRMGAELTRLKPTFVAPDNANTSFFGVDDPGDADSLPNFPGTSAAAPHAAAVAALALEKVPTATPADICNAFSTTAVDMGLPGVDNDSGHGHIDAVAALTELTSVAKKAPSDRCKTVTVSAASMKQPEGPSGASMFSFRLTKLGRTTSDVVVEYATAEGSAKQGTDYKEATGSVTFAANEVSKTIDVEVIGDDEIEPDETFDLTIKLAEPAPSDVMVSNSFGTATIADDDDPANVQLDADRFVTWGEAKPDSGSPGDEVRIAGSGFKPNTELVGTFHSTPVELGRITSNAAGSFGAIATIPPVESGRHHIEVTGENNDGGTRTIRYRVTVVNGVSPPSVDVGPGTVTNGGAPTVVQGSITPTSVTGVPTSTTPTSLPTTGANVTFFAQLGALLIVVGAGATLGSRRRRRTPH